MTDPTRDDDTLGDRADGDEPVDAEIIDVDGESVLDADIGSDAADVVDDDFPDITVEGDIDTDLVEMVEVGVRLQAERDEYLGMARRVHREIGKDKRRVDAQRTEQ